MDGLDMKCNWQEGCAHDCNVSSWIRETQTKGGIFRRKKFGKTNIGSVYIWSFSLNLREKFWSFFFRREAPKERPNGHKNHQNITKKWFILPKSGKNWSKSVKMWVKNWPIFFEPIWSPQICLPLHFPPPVAKFQCKPGYSKQSETALPNL